MKYLKFEGYQENGSYLWYECSKMAEFTKGNVSDYWYMNKLKRDTTGIVKLDTNTHLVIKKILVMKAVKTTSDKKPSGVIIGGINYVYRKEELHGTAGRKLVFKYYIL